MVILSFQVNAQPLGIGRRGFYLCNISGFVSVGVRNRVAMENNERRVFFEHAAVLGEVPIVVAGGFQTNPSESKILGALAANGSCSDFGAFIIASAWVF